MIEKAAPPLRLSYQLIIAIAIGLIAPFTGFAWPFALLTGLVIARDDRDRKAGVRVSIPGRVLRLLEVTGGVLAMLFTGVVVGGLIALGIVWLVIISERLTADADPTERLMARLILAIGAAAGASVVGPMIGANVSIGVGT